MSTERRDDPRAVGDQSFEVAGGAAEAASFGLDGLSHAGPLAVIVGLMLALVMVPLVRFRRRVTNH
jgi:hypothetical protein